MTLGVAAFVGALALRSPLSLAAWFVVPFASAAAASYTAPRSNFRVGFFTFILSGFVLFVVTHIAGRYGLADALDAIGTLVAFAFSLPVIALSAAAGAFLGERLTGRTNA